MADTKTWYVYLLCDPDTEIPFYVGKGAGNRINQHEVSFVDGNKEKHAIIRRIKEAGKQLLKKKIAEFTNEEDALIYEWATINVYHETITNIRPGNRLHAPTPVKQPPIDITKLSNEPYVSIEEIAEAFHMSRASVSTYIKELDIKTHKFGRHRHKYVARTDVELLRQVKEEPWKVFPPKPRQPKKVF